MRSRLTRLAEILAYRRPDRLPEVFELAAANLLHARHLYAYSWALPYVAGKQVLDIGVNEGYGLEILSQAAKSLLGSLKREAARADLKGSITAAFQRSTKLWRSIFQKSPAGWGRRARKRLSQVIQDTDTYIQTLNDQFTNPSGAVMTDKDLPELAERPVKAEKPVEENLQEQPS